MRYLVLCSFFLFILLAEAKKQKKLITGIDCTRSVLGYDYKGSKRTTRSGNLCQSWSFGNSYRLWNYFADGRYDKHYSVQACRNPWHIGEGNYGVMSRERPWCYVYDKRKKWDYCDIPVCTPTIKDGSKYKLYHGWGCKGRPGYQTTYGVRFCHAAIRWQSNGLSASKGMGGPTVFVFERQSDGTYRIRSESCHGSPCQHKYWYSSSKGWVYAATEREVGRDYVQHKWKLIPYADGWRIKRVCDRRKHRFYCNYYIGLGGGGFGKKYLGMYEFDQYFIVRSPSSRTRYSGGSRTGESLEKDRICSEKLAGVEERNDNNTEAASVPFTGEEC